MEVHKPHAQEESSLSTGVSAQSHVSRWEGGCFFGGCCPLTKAPPWMARQATDLTAAGLVCFDTEGLPWRRRSHSGACRARRSLPRVAWLSSPETNLGLLRRFVKMWVIWVQIPTLIGQPRLFILSFAAWFVDCPSLWMDSQIEPRRPAQPRTLLLREAQTEPLRHGLFVH